MMMIKVDDDNFNLAWEALKTRHENERILVYKPPTCQKKKQKVIIYQIIINCFQLFAGKKYFHRQLEPYTGKYL